MEARYHCATGPWTTSDMVDRGRLELPTPVMRRRCSTTELTAQTSSIIPACFFSDNSLYSKRKPSLVTTQPFSGFQRKKERINVGVSEGGETPKTWLSKIKHSRAETVVTNLPGLHLSKSSTNRKAFRTHLFAAPRADRLNERGCKVVLR